MQDLILPSTPAEDQALATAVFARNHIDHAHLIELQGGRVGLGLLEILSHTTLSRQEATAVFSICPSGNKTTSNHLGATLGLMDRLLANGTIRRDIVGGAEVGA